MFKKNLQNINQENLNYKIKPDVFCHFHDVLIDSDQKSYIQSNYSRNAENSLDQFSQDLPKDNSCQSIQILEAFIRKLGQYSRFAVSLADYSNESNIMQFNPLKFKIFTSIFKKTLKKNQKSKYKKINWGKQDLIILIWVMDKYSKLKDIKPEEFQQKDWEFVASLVPAKNGQQCMFKWLNLNKNKLNKKFPWTSSEDQYLKQLIINDEDQKQKKWLDISKKLYLKNEGFKIYRTAKECRQRWSCFVNPQVKKGPWTISEDLILIQNYLKIGKKWAIIAKMISGRTENAVKNRFNLLIEKKKRMQYSSYYLSDEEFMKLHLKNLQCIKKVQIEQNIINQLFIDTTKSKQTEIIRGKSLTKNKIIVQASEYTFSAKKKSQLQKSINFKEFKYNKQKNNQSLQISKKLSKSNKNQEKSEKLICNTKESTSKEELQQIYFKGDHTNYNLTNSFQKSIDFIEIKQEEMLKLYSFSSISNLLANNSMNFFT